MIDCPKHEGAYDCTPFCEVCEGEQEWTPNKVMSYRYKSEYAEIVFNVAGLDTWSEEEFDSASEFDLKCYATDPEDYWLDDTWEIEAEGLDIRK